MQLSKKIHTQLVQRILVLLLLDCLLINVSGMAALFLRYELHMTQFLESPHLAAFLKWAPYNTLLTMFIFLLFQLYTSLWEFVSLDELERIAAACLCSSLMQAVAVLLHWVRLPRSFPALYGMCLLLGVGSARISYRLLRRLRHRGFRKDQVRTMVVGAGRGGYLTLREFKTSVQSKNRVVCIIDDDAKKLGRSVMGVPIVGGREDIPRMVEKYHVEEIVVAIPSLSPANKKELLSICHQTGCRLKQLPGLYQIANGEVTIQQIRDVEIEDLLGRSEVHVDMHGLSQHISGKTVLVTGGGGSIGSELCRQLAALSPARLIIFDIYENNAYAIEQDLRAHYPNLTLEVLIGSVRDYDRIFHVINRYRPAMVFHAAAHKHVPLMEHSPLEAVKNNVFGTLNTAKAAALCNVGHFVLISTDKAVNPTNIMGASKRICEMIMQMMSQASTTVFCAVRFGNVLGSNGSVIPLFREQIKAGGPVTVTHPEITRFFMTIPEAVSLVLQAAVYAQGNEVFVLDMGQPVRIDDLARNIIRLSGLQPDVDIPIVYTGLRPGEKLYEEILLKDEGLDKTANDLIYVGKWAPLDISKFQQQLEQLHQLTEADEAALRQLMGEVVSTYHPSQEVTPPPEIFAESAGVSTPA